MRMAACIVLSMVLMMSAAFAGKKSPSEGNPVPLAVSSDPTYGTTEKNPIKVGRKSGGPPDEETYLKSLRGPKGEAVVYKRAGSCCFFETPNALMFGKALLDKFEVTYEGLEKAVILYLDLYDYEQPLVPVGFTKAG